MDVRRNAGGFNVAAFDKINVETIAIVGTGPSVKNKKIEGDLVIAVNSAIEFCNPDWWFTLDPSPQNLQIMENPINTIKYFAAVPNGRFLPPHVYRLERVAAANSISRSMLHSRRLRYGTKTAQQYYLLRWAAKLGLSENPNAIHTGNSLWGAYGLAYHCRPKRIVFYGLDGTQEPRITGGMPNRLDHLPALFESSLEQVKKAEIEVLNANPNSRVTCFPFLENVPLVC